MATPIPENGARFTFDELLAATGGTPRGAARRADVIGVTSDSRAVKAGCLFVALRGDVHDGHRFAAAAVRDGAAVLLVEGGAEIGDVGASAVVEVPDTLVAWGALARAHLTRWRAGDAARRVVAITGSAGKTTTKELTAALLGAIAPTHYTAGNLNNRVGVPAVVFALETARFCVLEMGMSLPGELDAITAFARPDVSVVVNVGIAHAEGVGGREGVMHEKGAVYRALGRTGVAIVNADDPFVIRAANDAHVARAVGFGRGEAAYRITGRASAPGGVGSRLTLDAAGRALTVDLPLPGEAAAIDFAAALAASETASGVALDALAIAHALASLSLRGRGSVHELEGGVTILDDTYNANPSSMRSSLATLAEIAGPRRRVAVLGEMKELGTLAEEEHRALGDAVAEAGVALLIGCGGLIALTLERARRRGVTSLAAEDAAGAASLAEEHVHAGDVVLVKASRGVRAERVVAGLATSRSR